MHTMNHPAYASRGTVRVGAEGEGDEEEEKEKALVNKLGDVLEKCLTMNRNKRITADDALAHSFFQE